MTHTDEHLGIPRLMWESEHEWRARCAFIDGNKDCFSDDRLESLSMSWSNWKFMGCSYGHEVQALLEDCHSRVSPEVDRDINTLRELARPKVKFVKPAAENLGTRTGPPRDGNMIKRTHSIDTTQGISAKKDTNLQHPEIDELIPGLTLYILSKNNDDIDLNFLCILNESAQKSNKYIEYIEQEGKQISSNLWEYTSAVSIDGKFIASGKGSSKKDAKRANAENAFSVLKDNQHIIYKSEVNHDHVETVQKGQLVRAAYMNARKLSDNNIGNKLLRKMGWSGSGGVGKYQHGISDPVFVDSNERREGVGHEFENRSIRKSTVEETLLSFLHDADRDEIKFTSELSREDRALIHKLCSKHHLNHKSFGKGGDRYLVVSKNKIHKQV